MMMTKKAKRKKKRDKRIEVVNEAGLKNTVTVEKR